MIQYPYTNSANAAYVLSTEKFNVPSAWTVLLQTL